MADVLTDGLSAKSDGTPDVADAVGPSAKGEATAGDPPAALATADELTSTSRRPSFRRDSSLPAAMCRLTVRTLSRNETAACSIVCQESAMAWILPWIVGVDCHPADVLSAVSDGILHDLARRVTASARRLSGAPN